MFKLVSLKTIGFKRLYIPESINFPEGRTLIFGVNESGKSTLLEAIHYALFGMGLRPNRRARNEDLINYNYSDALIELIFSIDEKKYHVRRLLKKTSVNEHQLNEVLPDGTISELTSGANSVNDQIQEILHGIDSDALLNSCLVEQKELGKLEDSSRQERIKAMSSLLNLEAFLDAKNEIKKDRNELEQVHNDTKIKLQKAEQATTKYNEAEKKHKEAGKKLKEIKRRQDEILNETQKLEELLSVLDEMNKLTSRIQESKARTEGLEGTIKQLESQLVQVAESEKELEAIENQLPEEKKKLSKVRKELEIIEELGELEIGKEDLRNQIEKTSLRIEEASRQLEEAHEAKRQIKELENRIEEYNPAKKASEKIPDLSKKAQQYLKNDEYIKQVKKSNTDIQNRLTSLKDYEHKINSLEKNEKTLQKEKKTSENRRSIGLVMAGFGIMALIFTLMNQILILPVIGLLTLASGGYLYSQSDPSKMDNELHKIREDREKLLGQISRIKEYKTQLSENQKAIEEKLNMKKQLEAVLYESLKSLPKKPSNYASFIELDNLEKSLNITREKIQSDIQNLTKLETMKTALSETAGKLEERRSNFQEQEKKLKQLLEEQNKINQEIDRKEKETELNLNKEGEIKDKYEKSQNMVTTLNTRRESAIETIKRKPGYETNLKKTVEQIDEIENIIKESEDSFFSLSLIIFSISSICSTVFFRFLS
jgi:exonuclease SbcC